MMERENTLWIRYGTELADMAYTLMEDAGVHSTLPKTGSIVVKPNLLIADKAENGATTHPEIVEGILRYLRDAGVRDITIAEGAWVGERNTTHAFDFCGFTALARNYGAAILDTKTDETVTKTVGGRRYSVCKTAYEAAYLIDVPVLKGHCQTKLTCAMKNMKGCIPDSEKRRYHTMGLHRPIAELFEILRPDLTVVDSICGDLTFEEGGNPVQTDRMLLGYDALLVDSYCARLIGYEPDEIGYLREAVKNGRGRFADESTTVIESGAEKRPVAPQNPGGVMRGLSRFVEEDSACSACFSALMYALDKVRNPAIKGKVKIGQGFRGKSCPGFGVGNCAAGCEEHVKGCPPTAASIRQALK